MKPALLIRRLSREELPVDTIELARFLIGKSIVRRLPGCRLSGRIVEVEAYPVGDSAGRAFHGRTVSNRSLFLGTGYAYVYLSYGSSFMFNVTSEEPGVGAGVLIRSLEPMEGLSSMKRRRRTCRLFDLARGPGRLTMAMDIDRRCDGRDLCASTTLWLGSPVRRPGAIGRSVRIGLSKEVKRLRRFYERGNPYVSGPRRLRP
jgi:DNA-3-methyladenine glycosylase